MCRFLIGCLLCQIATVIFAENHDLELLTSNMAKAMEYHLVILSPAGEYVAVQRLSDQG